MKREIVMKIVVFILSIAGISLFLLLLRALGKENIYEILLELKLWQVAIIVLFPLATFGLAAARLKIILSSAGTKISFLKLIKWTFWGEAISILVPS
ncbi:MAG: hypothetical protein ACK4NX_00100, partial [Candidatus Paceibacteria bacterium]